jgi:hypothetical protein
MGFKCNQHAVTENFHEKNFEIMAETKKLASFVITVAYPWKFYGKKIKNILEIENLTLGQWAPLKKVFQLLVFSLPRDAEYPIATISNFYENSRRYLQL